MTIVEKAAYLKGLAEGLDVENNSKEGKLWSVMLELLSDMAHEIEDLQESNLDHAGALDDISEELSYLEELTCDLDMPEDPCASCGGCCGAIPSTRAIPSTPFPDRLSNKGEMSK